MPGPTAGPVTGPARGGASAPGQPRAASAWSDESVAAAGLRAEDADFVTVGGGLAGFAVVDALRIRGVAAARIRVVSPQRRPFENLGRLIRTSQIRDDDPLRSDSGARADNVWGFPGYALHEAIGRRTLRPLWKVLTEPVGAEFYNPSPRQVARGLDREADRIGWYSMLVPGQAMLIRRRTEGGFFCLVHPADHSPPYVLRTRHLHLGTGYPALGYAPELIGYRLRHGEYFNAVNAYEPHEHVYQVLRRRAGTVLLRGAGITASRVLQRLIEDRDRSGRDVRILHLFRELDARPPGRHGPGPATEHGWRYQAFSFPKSAASGQQREELAAMTAAERSAWIAAMGGATTARRRLWRRQLDRARSAGCYRALGGEITLLEPSPRQGVRVLVARPGGDGPLRLDVDFLIDCTGMSPRLRDNPLLADLVDSGCAGVNAAGGLDVGPHFEVRGPGGGLADGPGRLYASGAIARGGHLATVDSFAGLVDAAQLICDDLAARGVCTPLGPACSAAAWVKWLAHRAP
ncbi:hypothetical protein [Actinomadura livida]|uniref:Uncharacterized protein n=1 Tax=Actinomadura livida TaxID=79909 RepID=A0A7W7MYF5_9ACTN|nr:MULTISPECIES: hypothetical protein [Actinomadura]MBB4774770.1 hypothetical protein [Actinomadura catellatispora]GGU06094.1 hypothetical protein GCM10010208_33030 [Actinomadura livida]